MFSVTPPKFTLHYVLVSRSLYAHQMHPCMAGIEMTRLHDYK
jgi:hypothetical protein